MNSVSLVGLLVLLGLAWALSFDRSAIRLRPIAWGLTLQVILALTILRRDAWSQLGLVLLGSMVVAFIADQRHRKGEGGGRWRGMMTACCLALVLGGICLVLPSPWLAGSFLALAVLLLVTVKVAWLSPVRSTLGSLLVVLGVAWIIASGRYGGDLFQSLGGGITEFLKLAGYGSRFLFGNLSEPEYFFPSGEAGWPGFGFQFAFYLLPVIIFFAAFMSVLYYLGIMQKVIEGVSQFMRWTIGTGGVETLSLQRLHVHRTD